MYSSLPKFLFLGLALLPLISGQTSNELEEEKEILEKASHEINEIMAAIPEGPQNGPALFYDEKHFLMRVTQGVKVHVFSKGSEGGNRTSGETVGSVYMSEATSVKGSMINDKDFSVTIDWKSHSTNLKSLKVGGLVLKMVFTKDSKEYKMIDLEVAKIQVNDENVEGTKLQVTTRYGYKVQAPLGLSFCCTAPGMFAPASGTSGGEYKIGVTFPDMQLQVYDVPRAKFGPRWYCGEIFSIGLWVGIIITFFFASICYWGFGMLAAINTMDRFDDPKGKPIHVPMGE